MLCPLPQRALGLPQGWSSPRSPGSGPAGESEGEGPGWVPRLQCHRGRDRATWDRVSYRTEVHTGPGQAQREVTSG